MYKEQIDRAPIVWVRMWDRKIKTLKRRIAWDNDVIWSRLPQIKGRLLGFTIRNWWIKAWK